MSIPGGNQSPYRQPCSGTVPCSNGPRYQHARAYERNIPVFIYDTLLPNAYIPPRGDIHPYERFNDLSAGPNCASDFCDGGTPAPCEGWIGSGSLQFNLSNAIPTPSFYQPQMLTGITLANAGANYSPGDILTLAGGTISTYGTFDGSSFTTQGTIAIGNVSNTGGIQTFAITAPGSYSINPTSPNNPTGGTGTGASFNLTFGNQTENISPCFKYGYKNVQAMRQWHGAPGYFWNTETIGVYLCETTNCSWIFYAAYSLYAPQSKYTTVSWTADYSVTGPEGGGCSDSFSAEVSVDPNTGVISVDSLSYGTGNAASYQVMIGTNPDSSPILVNAESLISMNALDLIEALTSVFVPDPGATDIECSADGLTFTSEFGFVYTMSWSVGSSASFTASNIDDDGFGESYDVAITDSAISFTYYQNTGGPDAQTINFSVSSTLSGSNTAEDILADIYSLLDEWDMTDDAQYPWRTDSSTSVAPLVIRNELGTNVSPIGFVPYVIGSTPIEDCYGYEPSNPLWTPTYGATTAVDANGELYDGSIIGAPLPPGYQQAFDWYYTDWENCTDSDTHAISGYIFGWGKLNQAQNGIPRTATHWTTNDLAWRLTGGAWIFYNCDTAWNTCTLDGGSTTWPGPGAIIAQKWAETKMGFLSENFFRPAGDDKFAYDETAVYTIDTITGSGPGAQVKLQLTMSCDSPNGSSTPISSISGLWGGPSVGGFYTLSGISGGDTVTLGTLVYNVPSDWQSASDTGSGESDFTFGRLRWSNGTPSSDPPPILGRANISNFAMYNGSNSVSELKTDSLPNLGMGTANADHVDIFDGSMFALASNQAVTRIDDSHFTINTGVSSLTNAAFIMSHGAPNYSWDDQYSKGDFIYNDFTYWPRLICEAQRWNAFVAACDSANCACPSGTYIIYCTPFFNPFADGAGVFDHAFTQDTGCVPFTPCSPSVLCISPNDESFAAGITRPFPASGGIYLDEQYGSGWYAEFQQVIVDPLWQVPHFPASNTGNCNASTNEYQWNMDDGFCQADDLGSDPAIAYYAHAPLVEARLAVPSGAPALPNGISLGWESPAGLTSCNAVPSDTLFPPQPNGYSLSAPQPIWSVWSLECQCIASTGRFANQYENEVIGCT